MYELRLGGFLTVWRSGPDVERGEDDTRLDERVGFWIREVVRGVDFVRDELFTVELDREDDRGEDDTRLDERVGFWIREVVRDMDLVRDELFTVGRDRDVGRGDAFVDERLRDDDERALLLREEVLGRDLLARELARELLTLDVREEDDLTDDLSRSDRSRARAALAVGRQITVQSKPTKILTKTG